MATDSERNQAWVATQLVNIAVLKGKNKPPARHPTSTRGYVVTKWQRPRFAMRFPMISSSHRLVWSEYILVRRRWLVKPHRTASGSGRLNSPVSCNQPATSSPGFMELRLDACSLTTVACLHYISGKAPMYSGVTNQPHA